MIQSRSELLADTQMLAFDGAALRTVLAHLFADMPEAVVVTDANRRIIMANAAACALFGYTHVDLIGRLTADLYARTADFSAQGRARYNPTADATHQAYMMRYRRRDGTVFQGETIGGSIHSEAGIMYLGIVRDVTARRATEQAIAGLHAITSDPELGYRQRRRAILELGCRHFGMPIGIVSDIDAENYVVADAIDPEDRVAAGDVFPIEHTYCCHVLIADAPFAVDHTADSALRDHACYRRFRLESYIGAPIRLDGAVVGTLNFSSAAPTDAFNQNDLDLIAMFGQWLSHEITRERDLSALRDANTALRQAHDRLNEIATLDVLTGLGNRRMLGDRFEQELARGRRYSRALSVALIDFDHFKQLNDRHGHAAGDEALQLFAAVATKTLRSADAIGRWGGEEFLVLLPETDNASAVLSLERLLAHIRCAGFAVDGEPVALSMSAGVATSDCDEAPEAIIKRADLALYRAKANGRDQIARG